MKLNTTHLLVFAFVLLTVASCKTLQTERPKESYLPTQLEPVVSELPLQIEIDVKKLETAVNREVQGLLFEEDKINNQDLSIKVWKAQDFTFNVRNNVIEYRVPLRLWSRFAWTFERFGLRLGDTYEANGSLALNYNTMIDIDRNWKLTAKTNSTGYQWIETPKVNVLGVSVPVTPIANFALQRSQQLITKEIDETLTDLADIKRYASMAWYEMQRPIQVDRENNIWLRINPESVHLSPFETRNNSLVLTLTLKAKVESFMGVRPSPPNPSLLPPLTPETTRPQDFNINIAADATFAKITELAEQELLNQTFTEGRNSITIKGISIFGSGGKAVLELDVTGTIKGKIYLMGDMVYNPEKMTVELQNPEFDLKTRNALHNSASWLLNSMIIRRITPYLSYSVKKELEQLKEEANKTISNFEVHEGISLNGKLTTLTVQRLDLVPGAVRVNANLKGNVALKINDLNW